MHPASHAAVGSAHHILAPDNGRPVDEAPRDELGMLHDVGDMADHGIRIVPGASFTSFQTPVSCWCRTFAASKE